MPSYVNSYFGLQTPSGATVSDAILKITDAADYTNPQPDEIVIDLLDEGGGWVILGEDGWGMQSAEFKQGGVSLDSSLTDGDALKHAVFASVVETINLGLNFFSPNDMLLRIDQFEELLKVRAKKYWTNNRYNKPVYLVRQMPGEGSVSFCLVSQGRLVRPNDMWDIACNLNNGFMYPIQFILARQPFWLGAAPGQVQATLAMSAQQVWNFDLDWEQESNTPSGQIFCFAELDDGTLFAGGESEILTYSGGSWSAVDTSPVTLAAEVTSCALLNNGDVLFGEDGRIIKRTAAGVWSVETTEPTGQVYALLAANTGEVYAGDSGRIIKRDTAGTWAEDDDLPDGSVYSLFQTSSGRLLAGEPGRILRSVDTQTETTVEVRLAASGDSAEQYGTATYVNGIEGDLDLFNRNYVGMRFELDVPQGATITSAVLRMVSHRTRTGASDPVRIYCVDADNASAFSGTTNEISGLTLTSAYRNWSTSTKWRKDNTYDSVNFKAALQEVIDRPGWTSGNYAGIVVRANTLTSNTNGGFRDNRREAHGWVSNPGKAVALVVTYTTPPAAGATWDIASTLPSGNVRSFYQIGSRIIVGEDGRFLASQDDGRTFEVLDTTPTGEVLAIAAGADGILYAGEAGAGGQILRSTDGGVNWAVDNSTLPAGNIAALHTDSNGDIRAGDDGYILILSKSSELTLGQEETDKDIVYVANHHKTANLTHVLHDRGGSYTSVFPMTSLPAALYPASVVTNDNVYFGIDTSLDDTGPFCGLVFNIVTPASATTSYAITWEYYNGSWTSLTVKDRTVSFSEVGVNSVTWAMPGDWTTTAVNATTGWWVRARLSALSGTFTIPTQGERNVYTASTAYIEMDDDQANGNIPSLVKIQFNNRSSAGAPGGSSPLLYANKIFAGVKPLDDHTHFRAFLNFASGQNPEGVSVAVTGDADSATAIGSDSSLSAIAGQRAFFDASVAAAGAGLNNLTDRVQFDLSTEVARDFYGTYRAFLRVYQSGGSAGEVTVRLKVLSGSGGISALTDRQVTKSTTNHELIEFDELVTLPVSSQFTAADIGDTTSIVVQIAASQSDADLLLYDLVLLPVDTAYIIATDQANTASSTIDHEARLLLDPITVPKAPIRALVQKTANDLFKANYLVDSGGEEATGELALPTVGDVRIWFLAARTNGAGSTVWLSEPEVTHSVRGWRTDRWLLGRGLA